MTNILFVCTANTFRSMSAEFIMRSMLPPDSDINVSSAGTMVLESPIHPDVLSNLNRIGIDPSSHSQRVLTPEILKEQDLVIAMGKDHQDILEKKFGQLSTLFLEASHEIPFGLPDVTEVATHSYADEQSPATYIAGAIETIRIGTPLILQRLPELVKN